MLNGIGYSYFSTAYDLFTPIYALSVSGFPVAVSKLVSENLALGRYRDVRRIRRISMLMSYRRCRLACYVFWRGYLCKKRKQPLGLPCRSGNVARLVFWLYVRRL
jgi:stage V sporulation protein B